MINILYKYSNFLYFKNSIFLQSKKLPNFSNFTNKFQISRNVFFFFLSDTFIYLKDWCTERDRQKLKNQFLEPWGFFNRLVVFFYSFTWRRTCFFKQNYFRSRADRSRRKCIRINDSRILQSYLLTWAHSYTPV